MSISAISVPQAVPSFKGSIKTTDNGIPYYKSNKGTVIGSATGGLGALIWLANLTTQNINEERSVEEWKKLGKNEQEIEKLKEHIKKVNEDYALSKKWAVPFAIIAAAASIGCGLLIDNLRNKKAEETASILSKTSPEEAYMQGVKFDYSATGQPYYKSNNGAKYGAVLGAVCGAAHGFMQHSVQKNILASRGVGKVVTIISSVISCAIGGFALGKLTDHFTNKKASEFETKMHFSQQMYQ